MKISKEQVMENRLRILDAGARMFRERGFEGVTVAEVMAAAGLTHGAFYGYFDSKEDLVACTFAHALNPREGKPALPSDLREFAALYLRKEHRDHPGDGCMVAALGAESCRSSAETRHTLTESARRQIEKFTVSAPGKNKAERRRAAIASWSAMIGAMILSRVVDDPAFSDEVLEETRCWLGAEK